MPLARNLLIFYTTTRGQLLASYNVTTLNKYRINILCSDAKLAFEDTRPTFSVMNYIVFSCILHVNRSIKLHAKEWLKFGSYGNQVRGLIHNNMEEDKTSAVLDSSVSKFQSYEDYLSCKTHRVGFTLSGGTVSNNFTAVVSAVFYMMNYMLAS